MQKTQSGESEFFLLVPRLGSPLSCERGLSGYYMASSKPEVTKPVRSGLDDRIIELEIQNDRLQRLVAELLIKNQKLRQTQLPEPGSYECD